MNTNPLGTVGLVLTLAGLVGSFFNIQLSQWLRDVVGLNEKITQNNAIVECEIEYARTHTPHVYIVNILVLLFVALLLVN